MSLYGTAVKKTAAFSLKNNYTSGVISACIYIFSLIVLSVCVDTASGILGNFGAYVFLFLLVVFLAFPLTLGYVYRGTSLIFTGECEPILIFKYFSSRKDYFKALKMSFYLTGNALFVLFLLSIPAVFAALTADGRVFTLFGAQIPIWASSLTPVVYILKYAAIIITVFVMLKYYMAPFLIAADGDMDPLEAIHLSRVISICSKRDFIKLAFSFTGYIIACFLVVPVIFVFPYFNAVYNVHCRFAVASYNKAVDEIKEPQVPNFNANITF